MYKETALEKVELLVFSLACAISEFPLRETPGDNVATITKATQICIHTKGLEEMDTYGKVIETIWANGTDDNGFFDYCIELAKRFPMLAMVERISVCNNKQKSVVFNSNNEFWVCQYITITSIFTTTSECILHIDSNGRANLVDTGIPNTDIYRLASPHLWTALSDFMGNPVSAIKQKQLAEAVDVGSSGVFSYQAAYHDIRSYRIGRSATFQEVAKMLSSEIQR